MGRLRDWAVAEAERAPDKREEEVPQGPFPSAKAFSSSPQLQLQSCFSLVAQMRPWWSPVSLVPASDTRSTPKPPSSPYQPQPSGHGGHKPPYFPASIFQECSWNAVPQFPDSPSEYVPPITLTP